MPELIPLLTKKNAMKIKIESAKGTYTEPDLALYAEDLKINPEGTFVQRSGTGVFLGNANKGQVITHKGVCNFKTELKGTGSGGLDATLAALLQACSFVKTAEVYTRSAGLADQNTLSITVWQDGKKKMMSGVSGTIKFLGVVHERFMLDVHLEGLWIEPSDEALPTFEPGTQPAMVMKGFTFSLATKAIKIGSIEIDTGCVIVDRNDYFGIADYDTTVGMDPEAHKVADYDYFGDWAASTEVVLVLELANEDDTITFDIPKLQYKELPEGERDKIKTYDINAQCNQSTGDDDLTITVSATA